MGISGKVPRMKTVVAQIAKFNAQLLLNFYYNAILEIVKFGEVVVCGYCLRFLKPWER